MISNSEVRMRGTSVSRGVGRGPAICLYGNRRQFYRTELADSQVQRELRRFRASIRLAGRQLNALEKRNEEWRRENAIGIIGFHRTILADELLLGSIEDKIAADRINAEWAVKIVMDERLAEYKKVPNDLFRERYIDLEDVTERIQTALGGERKVLTKPPRGSVIVARELNPTTLIEFAESEPSGIVTEHGGWTSHTYILARELRIPAVTGIKHALRTINSGDEVIVDGYAGEVIVRPVEETRSTVPASVDKVDGAGSRSGPHHDRLRTLDGREIIIRANADIAGGYERAKSYGSRGIGLFRSEYVFNRYKGAPTEDEQFEVYREIAEAAGVEGVRIRTFDLGTEEDINSPPSKNKNPALGLRAIRSSLNHEAEFRVQLRALLRAAHKTNVDIILPMVSDISEILRSKAILKEEQNRLLEEGVDAGSPRLGVMVEVPSMVLMIDRVVEIVELLCLGTNDLVQYLLAVDRDNEAVAKWFNTLNPAVTRSIKRLVKTANNRGIPCIVCGEMAGSPFYVPLLIGLGASELSMNPSSIPTIQSVVSTIAFEEALVLARAVEACDTAADAESVIRTFVDDHWKHLLS